VEIYLQFTVTFIVWCIIKAYVKFFIYVYIPHKNKFPRSTRRTFLPHKFLALLIGTIITIIIIIIIIIIVVVITLYSFTFKSCPITGLGRLFGLQKVEVPEFLNNQHMKAVKLSALNAGRLYPPRDTLFYFVPC
jgi:hypothetical protein